MNVIPEKLRAVVIIQARMASTRLPGKVMKDLAGKPVLWHIVDRVKHSFFLNEIIIATTTNPEDDVIESACKSWNILVFRGNSENVLKRYCDAIYFLESGKPKIDYIIRITGDCPLIDPTIIDKVFSAASLGHFDYASNTNPPTFPDGLDVEVISRDILFMANEKAILKSDREHVTPFIWKNPTFKKLNIQHSKNLSALRWTLDNEEDYELIKTVYKYLYTPTKIFFMADILKLLTEKPELKNINSHLLRNEGYNKSLKQDRIIQGDLEQ